MKKICLLDLKQVMDKFKSEMHKIMETSDLDPINVHIEDQRFHTLRKELERLIQIIKAHQTSLGANINKEDVSYAYSEN
jgi:cyanophycinase-like exopeptidase